MPAQLLTACPTFVSADFARTTAFYARFGYEVVSDHSGIYLILRRGGVELHFRPAAPDHDPATTTHNAYIRVLNIARFSAEHQDTGLPIEGRPRYVPPDLRPWGMIEAESVDPDGNLLIYGAPAEDLPAPPRTAP